MPTTPKTKSENAVQKVLKSIQSQEEIKVSISRQVSGHDLGNILQGINAFTQCFNQDDKYIVEIKVAKVISPDA